MCNKVIGTSEISKKKTVRLWKRHEDIVESLPVRLQCREGNIKVPIEVEVGAATKGEILVTLNQGKKKTESGKRQWWPSWQTGC